MSVQKIIATAVESRLGCGMGNTEGAHLCNTITQSIRTALREAGYAVVPVEPTEAMAKAGGEEGDWHSAYGDGETYDLASFVYQAMIQAAQEG